MLRKSITAALAFMAAPSLSAAVPVAYGIQIYAESAAGVSETPCLVSFPVDSPNSITTEMTLAGYNIRGAACDGSTYYLVQSDDGMVSSSLWTLDLATHRLDKVATYPMGSMANSLLVSDLTYDATTSQLYAIAFDLAKAVVGDDESVDAPFGLFTIDPATGATALVGYEDTVAFSTIAADSDGYLWAIDYEGSLWEVNKANGRPVDNYASSGLSAMGLQSMCFDTASGDLYWASCDGMEVFCTFGRFAFLEDMVAYDFIDSFAGNNEILGLYIDSDPVSPMAPDAPEHFSVTPGAEGAPTATLSWVNPLASVSGTPLEGTFDIKVMRSGVEVATLTLQSPGQNGSYTDTEVPSGLYDYCLVPVNGAGPGREAYALDVYIGVDMPGAVRSLTARKDSGSYDITVDWEAPAAGEHHGWFDSQTLAYDVVRLPDGAVIASQTSETTVTDRTVTDLAGYSYRVTPVTKYGAGPAATSLVVVSGPALPLPADFDFSTPGQQALWASVPNSYGDTWEGYCFSAVNLWCMRYFPSEIVPATAAPGWIVSPPMEMGEGKLYRLSYEMRTYGMLAPAQITVKTGGSADPADMVSTIAHIDGTADEGMLFKAYEHDFRAAANGVNYVAFGVDNLAPAWLANVKVVPVALNDLAVMRLEGLPLANVGAPARYTATVRNVGLNPIDNPSVKLVDGDGRVLAEAQTGKALAPKATATLTFTWTPEATGTYQLRAMADDDDNPADNASDALPVQVLDAGQWHEIYNGRYETAVTPTYLDYPYSYAQMLYTAKEIDSLPGKISALMWDYYVYNHHDVAPFDIKVYMANYPYGMLDVYGPVAESAFTLVYEGTVEVDPYGSKLPIVFDTEFDYTGGNVVIAVEQSNESGNTDLRYRCGYGDAYEGRTIYYRGNSPYAGTMSDTLQELANVSLLMYDHSGIGSVASDSPRVVDTEYYTLSGVRVAPSTKGFLIRVDRLADGSSRASKVMR